MILHTGKAGLWKYWVKDVVEASSLLFQKSAGQMHGRELHQQVSSGRKNEKKAQPNNKPATHTQYTNLAFSKS